MASFETTAFFSAPPEDLWRFVEEHGNEIEPLTFESESALAVGVLNHISLRILGVRVRGISRTTIWDPPFRCAFESVRPSWPVRATVTEDFEPADGGTRHVIRYEVTPAGLVGRVAAPMVCWIMGRTRVRYQRRLQEAFSQRRPE